MAKLALFLTLALAVAGMAMATPTCRNCPKPTSGFPYNPPKLQYKTCPSIRYSALTKKCLPWAVPVGQCCGVAPYGPCPAISCTAAFSYSSSGPGQCAQAYSVIEAATVSDTSLVAVTNYTGIMLEEYCQGSDPPTADKIISTAAALASAYAEAVATTLIYHNQFVCLNKFQGGSQCQTCPTCKGGNAVSIVKADVQAVALAASEAFASAVAAINDKYDGTLLAYGQADAYAVANAINIAVDSYYNKLKIGTPLCKTAPDCTGDGPATECKSAVAQALTCVFTQVLVEVYTNYVSSNDPDVDGSAAGWTPDAASCANAYSVSYSIGDELLHLECPDIDCPSELACDPIHQDCSAYNEYGSGPGGATPGKKLRRALA